MSTVEEIKSAITELPRNQYDELRKWFSDSDWKLWDAQVESDSASGKLDFLIEEAENEHHNGSLRAL